LSTLDRPRERLPRRQNNTVVARLTLTFSGSVAKAMAWQRCYAEHMPVWPDIVITKPDSPDVLLAIEVKAEVAGARGGEAQIKDYMVHQSCPVGMLVTHEDTFFFRNRYTGYEPETIQKIGQCRTNELLSAMPDVPLVTEDLVRRVEQWLENVQVGSRQPWPPSALEAIETCVLPVVRCGVIRAAGPRWRRTGS